jgi:dephospho-CoA kinase
MQNKISEKIILAFVGMPGAGKTEASAYLGKKGIPAVRFGALTDEGLKQLGLSLNRENEKNFREKMRKELGMGAYAIKSKPKIDELLKNYDVIILDGLYSWEEYVYLKQEFANLILINIYAEPAVRYDRLSKRPIRPLIIADAKSRDSAELEKLNKGGPIAIADYLIENNSSNTNDLYRKIDSLMDRLGIIK